MNKQKTLKAFHANFEYDYINIELYQDKGKKFIHVSNTINLHIDMEYKNNEQKRYIYNCMIELFNTFDFSYTLEYYSIESLEDCPLLCNVR